MNVRMIQVPYDSGNRSARMARGPEHFIDQGLPRLLSDVRHDVSVSTVEVDDGFTTEVGTTFQLNRILAEQAREAIGDAWRNRD